MNEMRKYPRVPFREGVHFHIQNLDQPLEEPFRMSGGCLAYDLSEGGIRCWVDEFIPLNTEITVDFYLDPTLPVAVTGRVVWVQKVPHSESYQIGLEFKDTSGYTLSRECLRDYALGKGESF